MTAPRVTLAEVALFLVAGLANTLFGYAAFGTFILLDAPPAVAVLGSTVFGILFNFRTLGRVFGDRDRRRLPRFLAAYAVLFAVNILLLHALIDGGLPALVAQALVVPLLAILSFWLMRRCVFAGAIGEPLR